MKKNDFIGTYKVVIAEVDDEDFGICVRETWTKDNVVHRINAPSVISRDPETMNIIQEEWYLDGVRHRGGDKPAKTFKNDTVTTLEWFEGGVHHRIGKPAIHETTSTGLISTEEWLLNGKHHRENAPAVIWRDIATGVTNLEDWFKEGQAHRLDGPAQIRRDELSGIQTDEVWYNEGKLFRFDGGAVIVNRNSETGEIVKSQTASELIFDYQLSDNFPKF